MLIELSHPIVDRLPVFPGDSQTELVHSKQFQTDGYNNHQLSINMHAGTHIDGPMHMLDCRTYLNEIPLETFIGDGCLLDVSAEPIIGYKAEYEQLIQPHQIVILHTGYSRLFGQPAYFTDYPTISLEFAELIVRKNVKMLGMDMPSPDKYPFEVHNHLFQHNVLLIENLTNVAQLRDIPSFEIIALPLNIQADSSIARVIARVK
ncbi:cyclase family protein [Paenibacillus sp. MMS18-CY102]|uniref:cyclase family protein n=1 Tax=Paenibacillus sp. MMS18-CY102 TaxID=2682849 RepID=UPI001365FB03|nr:cyclase family protein [Paenibacillus sp. MMS18-CY102]MWC26999.1 cyclase family protein [Paenibacillus sp. MMS18-CY102]